MKYIIVNTDGENGYWAGSTPKEALNDFIQDEFRRSPEITALLEVKRMFEDGSLKMYQLGEEIAPIFPDIPETEFRYVRSGNRVI